MRKFLIGLALLLCPVVAGAQIVTEPAAPFTGGTITSPLLLPDGAVGAPALAFANDPQVGIYRDVDESVYYNQLRFVRGSTTNALQGTTLEIYTQDSGAGNTRQYFKFADPNDPFWGAAERRGFFSVQSAETTKTTSATLSVYGLNGGDVTLAASGTGATTPGTRIQLNSFMDGSSTRILMYGTNSVTGDGLDVDSYIEWFDNGGTNYVRLTGPSDPNGTNVIDVPNETGTLSVTIASGALAFDPGSTNSGACAAAITDTATGALTTDVISWTFSADPTSTTGYDPSGDLGYIVAYPTADVVNFKFCNKSGTAIDPSSVTLNWRIDR
jgi:hypothetical protein